MMMCKKMIFVVFIMAFMVSVSSATTILANDDMRNLSGSWSDGSGLSVKVPGSMYSIVEFTFGGTSVSSATFNIYNQDGGITDLDWIVDVDGGEFDFADGSSPDHSGVSWTDLGQWALSTSVQWYNLDITGYYNSNLNKTITLLLDTPAQESGNGPKFEDSENSKGSGNVPYLETTPIPEPCTMLLLSAGLGMMIRRRRKA